MSGRRPSRQVLTDADVREILLAPAEVTSSDLAGRFHVSDTIIHHHRCRKSFRALAIARELGLIEQSKDRRVWSGRYPRVPAMVSTTEARRT